MNIIVFAFLTLITRSISDNCDGDRFGFQLNPTNPIFIFENGDFNNKADQPMTLEIPSEQYIGTLFTYIFYEQSNNTLM